MTTTLGYRYGPGRFSESDRLPSITCGHCRSTHHSVSEVRRCSGAAPRFEPNRSTQHAPLGVVSTTVPAGRYAVKISDQLRFYKIDKPIEGRWAGYTFVKEVAGDNEWPVKDRERRSAILAAIAVNPGERSRRYGREIGECGVCGRQLTDPASRAAGIGPVCAAKF